MLNIALPKGRLGDQVYDKFQKLGLGCSGMDGSDRRLVFENPEAGVRYLLVKPSDVAVYVVHGAADIGVVGKDVLLETEPDVYELCDLGIGKCRIVIAAKNGFKEDTSVPLRVATKYPHVTAHYYADLNRRIELIKLNGSIELAPVTGLSDVISDIVETGTTLKENNLSVLETIAFSSARLIANKSAYQFKREMIDGIRDRMEQLR
ncbi:MAG TPA: ATP phosphoribosyltransferase [Oscillospiraceae bacterium]|nr:ATP phosphoribosyltransferase [Oscillospiraceae bacterium]HPF56372.1 ATP phosphoribosyltransferase [Clostridiales bacterium]HPK35444.1 ATP phosphoribosyltransferase [Oscillospiraceae bacterium]HPR75168.1 ATP phosphoribosyltransferase [Oscillospiraceae bacterium]